MIHSHFNASSVRGIVSSNWMILHLHYTWILLLCLWKPQISSDDVVSDLLRTVLYDQSSYYYNQSIYDYRITVLPHFHTLSIAFDLKITTPRKGFLKEHVLYIDSPSTRLSFYLTGWGEFRIMHYNQEVDALGEGVNLLDGNPIHIPISNLQEFNHFRIGIVDEKRITVNIGDNSIHYHRIDRSICAQNEIMDVWLVKKGPKAADGVIKNVVIKASWIRECSSDILCGQRCSSSHGPSISNQYCLREPRVALIWAYVAEFELYTITASKVDPQEHIGIDFLHEDCSLMHSRFASMVRMLQTLTRPLAPKVIATLMAYHSLSLQLLDHHPWIWWITTRGYHSCVWVLVMK